jgi:hypothetical protein
MMRRVPRARPDATGVLMSSDNRYRQLVKVSDVEDYVANRLTPMIEYYEVKGNRMKRNYLRVQALVVAGGAVVPVLVSLRQIPTLWAVATTVGLLVGILAGLEGVLHYREQWKNYRSTEQYLVRELVFYRMGIGPYDVTEDRKKSGKLLVENAETAISAESSATLNVMTVPLAMPTTNGTGTQQGPVPEGRGPTSPTPAAAPQS